MPVHVNDCSRSPSSSGRSRSVTATRWSSCTARCRTDSGTLSMRARHSVAAGQRVDRRPDRLRTCRGTRPSSPGPAAASARGEPASSPSSSTVPNASAAHHEKSGWPPPNVITPSPSSDATREALRSVGGDDDRCLDRTRRRELRRVQHLHHRAVDLDLLTSEERPQLRDVVAHPRPRQRAADPSPCGR